VNGLIFCKCEARTGTPRKLLERDLYQLLDRVDDNIPEEPPVSGTKQAKDRSQYRTGTGSGADWLTNADALLEQCVHWDYFIKEKATKDNYSLQTLEEGDMLYSMGPRSTVKIGWEQIIRFCADILDEEPDPSMLQEVIDNIGEDKH
jgi:hypothetical protein